MKDEKKLKKNYEYVLVGINYGSLAFAHKLQEAGIEFCIIDSRLRRSVPTKILPGADLRVFTRVPHNSPMQEAPLSDELSTLQVETSEGSPLTFEKGEFKSFLGFGDKKVESMTAVLPYCQSPFAVPKQSPESYWQQCFDAIEDFVFLDHQITQIVSQENQIQELQINGTQKLQAQHFVFFDHFSMVFDELGKNMKKLASQFGKCSWFSSVNLVLRHSELPDSVEPDQLYLLMGSKEQACLGQWSQFGDHWISRWESFLPAELTQDSEITGQCFKEIKKQMKRAFPKALENVSEHILVQDSVFADLGKMEFSGGKPSNFNNLHLISPLFQGQSGWVYEVNAGLMGFESIQNEGSSAKNSSPEPNEVAGNASPC